MEHQLTITSGANAGFQDQMQVMAQIDLGAFEDEGFPEELTGTLLNLPAMVMRKVQSEPGILVDLGGQTYRFRCLNESGAFELEKDHEAQELTPGEATPGVEPPDFQPPEFEPPE